MKVAICFYGLTRSLRFTQKSIHKNLIDPVKNNYETIIYGHFFDVKNISNPRSFEENIIVTGDYDLINFDQMTLEQPDRFIGESFYKDVCQYGDTWKDECRSIKNLFHQLYSLNKVYSLTKSYNPDIIIFARPDLQYHDDFSALMQEISSNVEKNLAYIPNWQSFGGFNDRFAVAKGKLAADAIGNRYTKMLDYCQSANESIHSEKLLKYSLTNESIKIFHHNLRASRIRSNGIRAKESFRDGFIGKVDANFRYFKDLLSIKYLGGIKY